MQTPNAKKSISESRKVLFDSGDTDSSDERYDTPTSHKLSSACKFLSNQSSSFMIRKRNKPIKIYSDEMFINRIKSPPNSPEKPRIRNDEITPPSVNYSSRHLRLTPERLRRSQSPLKRSGSVERFEASKEMAGKRKRSTSVSSLDKMTPLLVSPMKKKPKAAPLVSPMKRFSSSTGTRDIHCQSNIAHLATKLDFSRSNGSMVPLASLRKQSSIDEKLLTEEDADVGDSTKTIKRGQGYALARSVSLKLSPKRDLGMGATAEKSSSTPALPTSTGMVKQASTSSLRFKVSPSTLVLTDAGEEEKKVACKPSTSNCEDAVLKSALKKSRSDKRDMKKIRFNDLNVFYFGRMQGKDTVPTFGEISLGMNKAHFAEKNFSLVLRRPNINLEQDGNQMNDNDEAREDIFMAGKHEKINQKTRVKMLKRSGVEVQRSDDTAETWRNQRLECGCSCENGVCLPETCQCALNGIQCQVDDFSESGEPLFPCVCFEEFCTNPNGRIFYDADAVYQHRRRVIQLYEDMKKKGIYESPVVRRFRDEPDESEESVSPMKYPVTPVYTRRPTLSAVRESISEIIQVQVPNVMENDVCVEDDKRDNEEEPLMMMTKPVTPPHPLVA